MAEWLRRLTRNQFPSGSVGSNPTDCESRYLSHAKRALYHLSYAPILKYSGQLEIFVAAAAVLSISLSDCVELVRTEVVSDSVG